jgi:hypothetical protein
MCTINTYKNLYVPLLRILERSFAFLIMDREQMNDYSTNKRASRLAWLGMVPLVSSSKKKSRRSRKGRQVRGRDAK